jgi:hypothetical protein
LLQGIENLGSFTFTFTLEPPLKMRFHMGPGSFSSTRKDIYTVSHTSNVSDASKSPKCGLAVFFCAL